LVITFLMSRDACDTGVGQVPRSRRALKDGPEHGLADARRPAGGDNGTDLTGLGDGLPAFGVGHVRSMAFFLRSTFRGFTIMSVGSGENSGNSRMTTWTA